MGKGTKTILEHFKNQIDEAEIISFDVFDTLLLRKLCVPKDVFLLVERHWGKGFAAERVDAESRARKRSEKEDVTLEEIYQEMNPQFRDALKDELEAERRVLYQNPELKEVFDYVRECGKKVVLISDMYLPRTFLEQILMQEGFSGWEKFYLSSEVGKTKDSGNLFSHVVSDMGIRNTATMLHIGDSRKSDYVQPKKKRIRAVRYKKLLPAFLASDKRMERFYKQWKTNAANRLFLSAFVGCSLRKWHNERFRYSARRGYWFNLGFRFAAPLALSMARFCSEEARKHDISNLIFAARDGWLVKKIFEKTETKIKTHYVFASRILSGLCLSGDQAKANMASYRAYLKRKGVLDDSGSSAIFDTITRGQFSSQRLVETASEKQILGFYWRAENAQGSSFSYSEFSHPRKAGDTGTPKNWEFVEFLLSSPEYPVGAWDCNGGGVSFVKNHCEEIRSMAYGALAKGALALTEDIQKIFGSDMPCLQAEALICLLDSFFEKPSKTDRLFMSEIKCAADSSHQKYKPLFNVRAPWYSYVFRPLATMKLLRNARWLSFEQKIYFTIFCPMKFRRGKLILLPAFHKK